MQLINTSTDHKWAAVDTDSDEDGANLLDAAMERLLACRYLAVLAGLGTSLGIETELGRAPAMSDLWEAVRLETGPTFDSALEKSHYQPGPEPDVETFLSKCQAALALEADEDLQKFVQDAERVIADACRFVGPDTHLRSHESMLTKIVRRNRDDSRLQVFTTNYDLAFEVAASSTGAIVIDGFGYTYPSIFDSDNFVLDIVRETADGRLERVPSVFRLYKLHGSVDWTKNEAGVAKDAGTPNPVIVYPRSEKFEVSYEPPFFDSFSAFHEMLRRSDVGVIVVGFGFRDRHIVQPLLTAFRKNADLQSIVVDPKVSDEGPTDAHRELLRLIRSGDQRHTLVAATFEEFVDAIPQWRHLTQREIHARRLGWPADE